MKYTTRFALAALLASCTSTGAPGGAGGYVEVGASHLAWDARGSGTPVVLLQGAQVGRGLWDAEMERFARTHRVVRYDVRGFGESGPEAEPFGHHEDLPALLDHLRIERAHLVGLSLGGRIALDFCLEHPERVRSLTLAGPGLSGFEWSDDGTWDSVEAAVAMDDPHAAALAWLAHPYMAPAMDNPALRPRLRQLALENARVWTRESHERPLDPPAAGRLGEVRAPVLLLLGGRDVADIHHIVAALAAGIPHAERAEAPDAGHVLNMERPEWFQRTVLEFLARCDARR